jgi:hypothetical protein
VAVRAREIGGMSDGSDVGARSQATLEAPGAMSQWCRLRRRDNVGVRKGGMQTTTGNAAKLAGSLFLLYRLGPPGTFVSL